MISIISLNFVTLNTVLASSFVKINPNRCLAASTIDGISLMLILVWDLCKIKTNGRIAVKTSDNIKMVARYSFSVA